ncbi:hypothetical protein [Leptothoe spongobia]|uniref:Uncharacterized protein n=1 Tax=Leptothoe spongobia TAU-MAC 1115 TaxID=1967444 RepID=A0A947GFL5_9CYAN|nr:hypothetical protein [Leptothoe spongobia]MBT9313809.1 hypothetical protein [Leptothoe spongobia TAU-MAC 1115]
MSSSPAPKSTVNFFTSAILLFGGSFGGTHLTALVAPYSHLSGLVGFLMFPIAFISGMQLWPWAGMALDNIRTLVRQVKRSKQPKTRRSPEAISSFTFILTSVATSLLAGVILTPPAMQTVVEPGYKILITAGTIYGVICWILIQLGYLRHADVYSGD